MSEIARCFVARIGTDRLRQAYARNAVTSKAAAGVYHAVMTGA